MNSVTSFKMEHHHIEYIDSPNAEFNHTGTLCGEQINPHHLKTFEGLDVVNCPDCLMIVAISKASNIHDSRLPDVIDWR